MSIKTRFSFTKKQKHAAHAEANDTEPTNESKIHDRESNHPNSTLASVSHPSCSVHQHQYTASQLLDVRPNETLEAQI